MGRGSYEKRPAFHSVLPLFKAFCIVADSNVQNGRIRPSFSKDEFIIAFLTKTRFICSRVTEVCQKLRVSYSKKMNFAAICNKVMD
jgi:hypothetical protein